MAEGLKYRQWEQRRKDWFWKLFLSGVNGIIGTLVAVFSILESLEIPSLKIGVLSVLCFYSIVLIVSIAIGIFCSCKMKQIRNKTL
jgi:uncharacterized membrane protein HdeD (DUF308 family)